MPIVLSILLLGACTDVPFRPDDTESGDDDGPVVSEPPSGLSCDPAFDTPAPGGDPEGSGECITQVITCGETVQGNNAGGSTVFGSEPGQAFSMCAGSASQQDDLDGPERVYELHIGEETRDVTVELLSCTRSLVVWYQDVACADTPVNCNYPFEGTYYEQYADVALANTGVVYFVVEGVDNDGGNFELTVDCY